MHLLKRLLGAKPRTEEQVSKGLKRGDVGPSPRSPSSPAIARTTENAVAPLTDENGPQSPLMPEVSDATKEEIQGIITRGLQMGLEPEKVARQIADKLTPYMAGRSKSEIRSLAHTFVVTRNAQAHENGGLNLAREVEAAGIEMEKSWLASGDERVCKICKANADAGWIPLHRKYPSGHMHPPGCSTCRCCGLHRMKE